MTTIAFDFRDVIAHHVRALDRMMKRRQGGVSYDPGGQKIEASVAEIDTCIEEALAEIDARAGAGQLVVDWNAFDALAAETVRQLADHALAATEYGCPTAIRARRVLGSGQDILHILKELLRWCEWQDLGPGSCPWLQLQGWALIILHDVLGKTRPEADSKDVHIIRTTTSHY
jgi:hypothetical protein